MGLHTDRDRVYPGEWFGVGFPEALFSADNSNRAELDADGYLRVYRGADLVWQVGPLPGAAEAVMLTSGSLVVQDAQGRAIWQTTSHTTRYYPFFIVQDDGNVVIYDSDPSGNIWAPLWATGTESHGWTILEVLSDIATFASVSGLFPGADLGVALATGQDPVSALRRDTSYLSNEPKLAEAVLSGDYDTTVTLIQAQLKNIDPSLAIPGNILNAIHTAVNANDLQGVLDATLQLGMQDPAKVQAFIASPGYPSAWTVITNAGRLNVPDLPPPPGLAYVPGAPTYIEPRPQHTVPLHTGPGPATPSASSSGAATAAVVVGVPVVAFGLYAWLTKQTAKEAAKTLVRKVRGAAGHGGRQENPTHRQPMRVQSVLVPTTWPPAAAISWVANHGYRAGKMDRTDDYYRFRQEPPRHFKVLRTIAFGDSGIKAVVGR